MNVYITGICGTLGTALAELHLGRGDRVWGCTRNDSRANEWVRSGLGRLGAAVATVFVGDAAALNDPRSDQSRAMIGCDVLYHCAAMKHVDVCESNPAAAWRNNVDLTWTVAAACETADVRFVLISSDKACLPRGVYGATKLVAERVALNAGGSVVRLGNLIGSSGSVFALWSDPAKGPVEIALTDPDMTRFFITVDAAARFIADRLEPGKLTIPRMRAVRMGAVADAMKGRPVRVVGPRPGETTHQWLIAPGDRATLDARYSDRYVFGEDAMSWPDGLTSETADRWDVSELLQAAGVKI